MMLRNSHLIRHLVEDAAAWLFKKDPTTMFCALRMTAASTGLLLGLGIPAIVLADPVTYAGKLGNNRIVVEFTSDPVNPDGPVGARYFYRSQGADIPLQALLAKDGKLELAEEAPCGREECPEGKPAPIGATWRLSSSDGGKTLRGSWDGHKTHAIELERIGSRAQSGAFPQSPLGLFQFSDRFPFAGDEPITMQTSPYDYLRLDVPLTEGGKEGWGDVSFRYVADPRTRFPMPRIISVAGELPVGGANALLQNRHWRASLAALNCVALQYSGFHEPDLHRGPEGGSFGGYEDSVTTVTFLSPTLMSWTESGSIYCGGAHPFNYSNSYTMDVAHGTLLGMDMLFRDWVNGKPGREVVAFVKQRRPKPDNETDIAYEAECGIDDLIEAYLVARFERAGDDEFLVFGLEGLPHAINACAEVLLKLPVLEVRHLLTTKAASLLRDAPAPK